MRNILITVMMLILVAVMFNEIVADDTTGVRSKIKSQGTTANTTIENLEP